MPKVVFYYFNAKGLGESCRMLLAYGGQEFEDRRIAFKDWAMFKPIKYQYHREISSLSLAIARYLGHKYGLVGDTLEDALEIDQNVDLHKDLMGKGIEVFYEVDEFIKEAKYADFTKNVFPEYLERLNAVVVKNKGHIALGKLTWGDFVLAGAFDYLKSLVRLPELEKKYPAFQKVVDTVNSIPAVKAYGDAAPEREFQY